jgi:hypothetical protein
MVLDLPVGNTTAEERLLVAGWVHDALARLTSHAGSNEGQARAYRMLLGQLEK